MYNEAWLVFESDSSVDAHLKLWDLKLLVRQFVRFHAAVVVGDAEVRPGRVGRPQRPQLVVKLLQLFLGIEAKAKHESTRRPMDIKHENFGYMLAFAWVSQAVVLALRKVHHCHKCAAAALLAA